MKYTYNSYGRLIQKKQARLAKVRDIAESLKEEIANLKRLQARLPVPKKREKKKKERIRSLSERWKKLLCYIGNAGPAGISTSEMMTFCEQAGLGIRKEILLSQLTFYSDKKFIKRVKKATFSLTKIGEKMAGWSPTTEEQNNHDFLRAG